jgi:hypothetical protein
MFSRNFAGILSCSANRDTDTIGDPVRAATPSRISVRNAYSPRFVSFIHPPLND